MSYDSNYYICQGIARLVFLDDISLTFIKTNVNTYFEKNVKILRRRCSPARIEQLSTGLSHWSGFESTTLFLHQTKNTIRGSGSIKQYNIVFGEAA